MASNNPQDYIHPIIQAMLASVAADEARAQLEQRKVEEQNRSKEAADDRKLRENQLKQQEQLAKAQYDLNKANLDFQHKQAGFENLIKIIGQGGEIPRTRQLNNTGSPRLGPEVIQDPLTGETYSPEIFPTLQKIIQGEASRAAGITTAQARALEPFKQAEDQRQQGMQELLLGKRQGFEAEQNVLNRASQEKIAQMRDATDRYTANLSAQIKLQELGRGNLYDESVIDSYIKDAYITGNTPENLIPAKLRPAIRSSLPKGWTPLTKTDQEQLNGVPLVQQLVNDVKLLAQQGTGIGGTVAAVTGIGYFGAAGDTRRRIDGTIGNLSRIFGGEKGVLTQRDVERMQKLVYSALTSKESNVKNADTLEDFLTQKLRPLLTKYNPDQLNAILTSRGIDPDKYTADIGTEIELDDGTRIPDTPENRRLHGLQ